MSANDAYLFGMTVWSTIHKLAGDYPPADSYGEIAQTFRAPGGETMNAAMLLSALGLRVRIAGPQLGSDSSAGIRSWAGRYGIDLAGVEEDEAFRGVCDCVIVDGGTRTVFGYFADYFSGAQRRWSPPDPEAIASAKVVGIDPFFPGDSEKAAELCLRSGTPYVTIDCPFDGLLHRHSAATVVSGEYRRQGYPGRDDDSLFGAYREGGSGLTVFTSGAADIRYARAGCPTRSFSPYRIQVKSSLGAGDTFRAGILYGLYRSWDDDRTVAFASALAAILCTRMPIAGNTPSLEEVLAFMEGRKAG